VDGGFSASNPVPVIYDADVVMWISLRDFRGQCSSLV